MELLNSFVVNAPIDEAWKTLLDVERVAPCMPGATLTKVEGDDIEGSVKVKLGPVTMTYAGKARFVTRDDENYYAVIEGTGKETKGTGTAKAVVHTALHSEAPDRTRVEVTTDLTITGKAAQFGRGVMQDVAGRLIDQFADNLSAVMHGAAAPAAAAAAATGTTTTAAPAAAGGAPTTSVTTTTAPAQPVSLPHQAEAIDLLGTAGAPVAKRAVPAVLAVLVLGGLIWWLLGRRRKS